MALSARFPKMASVDWLIAIVSGVFGGGFLTAIVAVIKARSETAKTMVDAAGGAVMVQSSVITSLHGEIARLRELLTEAIRERDEYREAVEECQTKLDVSILREHTLSATLDEFNRIVERLEQRIKELSRSSPPHHNAD